ncbi:hypothetical protein T492DRAFT_854265, partial [Pavlovales sp. CCMP2436]
MHSSPNHAADAAAQPEAPPTPAESKAVEPVPAALPEAPPTPAEMMAAEPDAAVQPE